MENIKKLVDDLYNFRDRFFESHSIDEAKNRPALIKARMDEVVKELDKADKSLKTNAEYLMLYGKALNVATKCSQKAEEMLCKAVKLDPLLTEAWTSLGECYWKNGDLNGAQNCFLSAVNHKKDKVSLRNLSMITRSMGSCVEEKYEKIQCSFDMAKEAVKMDLNDGLSWLTLGNAYIARYFITRQNPELMKQALSAFSKAERDPAVTNSYDLHFNKGTVHEYLENFEEALQSYSRTKELNPAFDEASKKEEKLVNYLKNFSTLVNTIGGIKKKQVKLLLKMIDHRKDCMFHPYGEELSIKSLAELSVGPNPKTLYVGRVVGSLNVDDPICFTFALIDAKETCVGVTLYNASRNWGVRIGDSILITEPNLKRHGFSYNENSFNFSSLRVESPCLIMVNGKVPNCDAMAPTILTQSVKSE